MWNVAATPTDKRRFIVGKLLARLGVIARGLVRQWNPRDFDRADGVDLFLQKSKESPLIRQPLFDVDMHLTRWYTFRRMQGETAGEYLIREQNMHTDFLSAMRRLRVHLDVPITSTTPQAQGQPSTTPTLAPVDSVAQAAATTELAATIVEEEGH